MPTLPVLVQLTDFEGYVVTWSFGDRPGLFRSHDFEVELEVPPLGRNVPVLIGLSSSSAEVVDGKQSLLHPIVTCLARAGEIFDPPLYLRFPVGDMDSAESGSEHGSQDDAELAYRARLESTFSVLTREDASAEWIPIHGRIVQTEEGLLLLQVTVSHFCDFALKQYINVDGRSVELIELPRLRHKSRRSHFHFVNLGTDELVVHCWGAARKRGFPELIRVKLGVGPMSGDAEVEARRTPVDVPGTVVYKVDVPGRPLGEPRNGACLVVDGAESLIVTYTTQETVCSRMGRTYEKVQVYGTRTMQHKHAMIFGDDLTGSKRMVSNLVVEDGDNVGEVVRSRVG